MKGKRVKPKREKGRGAKAAAKLATRLKVYTDHGQNPRAPANPSNDKGPGHDMHKPGSLNPRK
jgi:hypothetical protein